MAAITTQPRAHRRMALVAAALATGFCGAVALGVPPEAFAQKNNGNPGKGNNGNGPNPSRGNAGKNSGANTTTSTTLTNTVRFAPSFGSGN
jgi:hypothetical protein